MLQLTAQFPDIKIDTTQFNVTAEQYIQSQSFGADTTNKTWCDFYIPPRSTIIKHYAVFAEVDVITNAGVVIDIAAEEVKDNTTISKLLLMHNGPFNLESFYILNGNSTGDILYEINNNAGIYLDM